MAYTSFGNLPDKGKIAWVKEAIKVMREDSFFARFTSTKEKSIVQEVRELTKTSKGHVARIGLVQDLAGTGVSGDGDLEGNEEAMEQSHIDLTIDQLRNATRDTGKMDNQKSVYEFREHAKDKLGAWAAKTMDELQVLTLTGVSYGLNTNGSARVVPAGQTALTTLAFAADVTAPTAARHFNFNGTDLVAGDTTTITAAFVPTYKMLLQLKATAIVRGLKPLNIGGKSMYVLLMDAFQFAKLKEDADFRGNFATAAPRSNDNPIFTGADGVTQDGIIIHTSEHVFNTRGAASGSKWGATGTQNGAAALLLGCQALAMVNIHAGYEWEEKRFNYNNSVGISLGLMFGMVKPKFKSMRDGATVQDFGVIRINTAI